MGQHSTDNTPAPKSAKRRNRVTIVSLLTITTAVAVAAILRSAASGDASEVVADPVTSSAVATVSVASSDATTVPTTSDATTSTPEPAATAASTTTSTTTAPCQPLTIVAASEIVPALTEALTHLPADHCDAPTVVAADSADFASSWSAGDAPTADVWVPDSSLWVARAQQAGHPVPSDITSIASSPVVLAMAQPTAQALGAAAAGSLVTVDTVLKSRSSAAPVRVGLASPRQSAATIGVLLAVKSAVIGQPDALASLTWGFRSSPADLPPVADQLLNRLSQDANTAVPVTEQAVLAHNRQPGATPATPLYPATAGTKLDYPFVITTAGGNTRATALLHLLSSPVGRDLLHQQGFRDPDGTAPAITDPAVVVDGAAAGDAALPATADVDQLVTDFDISNEPSRLLGLLDISGSMESVVDGTNGLTRIQLATQAAARGVMLYPRDSELGLWAFSRNLTDTTDYREMVPVIPIGPGADGVPGQQRLVQALTDVRAIPDGGTGLYDSTLAAVREMRAHWEPNRINSVLILSDGMNHDADSISLQQLLDTLKSEADPQRPVVVISIAFGPESDVAALTQISSATGGPTYVAKDPRDIGEIFLDSVGQRICRPNCPGNI